MSDNKVAFGVCDLIFAVFLTLRLTDKIDWAWYWVAAPLWIPIVLVLVIAGIGFALSARGD